MSKRRHAPIEVTIKLRIKGRGKVTVKAEAGPGDGSIMKQAHSLLHHVADDAHRTLNQ